MGISLNKDNLFTITNGVGDIKFSLENRMPHIIHDISGTVEVPRILVENPDYQTVERIEELVVLANTYINSSVEDSFILPFYSISGGYLDTASKQISGIGSTMIRQVRQATTKEFLGSSILDIIQEDGMLKLMCSHHLDRSGFANIEGDDVVYLSYRIYYGRFK
jgi:hypothetical protein